MNTVVSLDGYLDEWYPGHRPDPGGSAYVVEPVRPFRAEDESRFWFLDFHWPRGLTPLGLVWNEDGYSWGSQLAAESLSLPTGRGVAQRMAGTHTYASAIPVPDEHERRERAARLRTGLSGFLAGRYALEGPQCLANRCGIRIRADRRQPFGVELDARGQKIVLAREQHDAGVDELAAFDVGHDTHDRVGEGASRGHARPPR